MHERVYLAYIVASKSRTLYVGVTNDLLRRVLEHKQKKHAGFSARYNCNRLVWFQRFSEVSESIQREKELKGWGRDKKTSLIESANSTWEDLSQDWYPNLSIYLPTHPHPCHPESPRVCRGPQRRVFVGGVTWGPTQSVSGAKDLFLLFLFPVP